MTDNKSRENRSREMWWEDDEQQATIVSAKRLYFSRLCLATSNALSGIQRAGYCMMRYGQKCPYPSVKDKSSSAGCYAATIDQKAWLWCTTSRDIVVLPLTLLTMPRV